MRYFSSIDTGNKLGSKPHVFNTSDQLLQLPEQQCYTADWKCVLFNTKLTMRVCNPVHYLVNVQDPINSTLLLCETLIRDIAARYTFDEMFDNKASLEHSLQVS